MKRFRWKLAVITFLVLIASDALLLLLDIRYPGNSVVIKVSRVLQLPGLPFVVLFPVPLGAGDDYTWDYVTGAVVCFFSAVVWSVIVGLFVGRQRDVT
jgi:hypothetical protein